jgi:predicted nucleotidyltransferase
MGAVSKTTTSAIRSPLRVRRSKQLAPANFYWWPITAAKIRKAAQKIVDEVDPEKIILFGSFAYGEPTPDSDVDLLIIMKTSLRPVDRIRRVSTVLDPRPFPVDIIVRTPAELTEQLRIKDCFIQEIIDKGQIVYERSSRR